MSFESYRYCVFRGKVADCSEHGSSLIWEYGTSMLDRDVKIRFPYFRLLGFLLL